MGVPRLGLGLLLLAIACSIHDVHAARAKGAGKASKLISGKGKARGIKNKVQFDEDSLKQLQQLQQTFHKLDLDNSGGLSFQEFSLSLGSDSYALPFKNYDANHDGSLDLSELITFLQPCKQITQLVTTFNKMDVDNDGSVDYLELANVIPVGVDIMAALDTDGDGALNFEEVCDLLVGKTMNPKEDTVEQDEVAARAVVQTPKPVAKQVEQPIEEPIEQFRKSAEVTIWPSTTPVKQQTKPSVTDLKSGKLDDAAVIEILHPEKAAKIAQLKITYTKFDKNHDGIVTLDEVSRALKIPKDDITRLDLDQNGALNLEEMTGVIDPALHSLYDEVAAIRSIYEDMDIDNSGDIDPFEFKCLLTKPAEQSGAKFIFKDLDANNDGVLSFREIMLFLKQQMYSDERADIFTEMSSSESRTDESKPRHPRLLHAFHHFNVIGSYGDEVRNGMAQELPDKSKKEGKQEGKPAGVNQKPQAEKSEQVLSAERTTAVAATLEDIVAEAKEQIVQEDVEKIKENASVLKDLVVATQETKPLENASVPKAKESIAPVISEKDIFAGQEETPENVSIKMYSVLNIPMKLRSTQDLKYFKELFQEDVAEALDIPLDMVVVNEVNRHDAKHYDIWWYFANDQTVSFYKASMDKNAARDMKWGSRALSYKFIKLASDPESEFYTASNRKLLPAMEPHLNRVFDHGSVVSAVQLHNELERTHDPAYDSLVAEFLVDAKMHSGAQALLPSVFTLMFTLLCVYVL